jgi:hypothetical protein
MTNSVNDDKVSSPYKVFTRPKGWKPLPSPRNIKGVKKT